MVPPATATAAARRTAPARPGRAPARSQPPLRVVPTTRQENRRAAVAAAVPRRRLVTFISVALVVGALLVVVVGQAMLANGQVRLSTLEHQLTLEQGSHRQAELGDSQLETPSRIVGAATSQGMIHPAQVTELPYVSLTTPIPTPDVTPAPATPPASTGQVTTATGSTSSTSANSTTAASTTPLV
jgi:hypothetical protein